MKKSSIYLMLSLLLAMLLPITSMSGCALASAENDGSPLSSVVRDDAFNYPDENGLYSIAVFLSDIPEDTVRSRMLDEYGVDLSQYDDDETYQTEKAASVREEYNRLVSEAEKSRSVYGCVLTRDRAVSTVTATTAEEACEQDRAAYAEALQTLAESHRYEAVVIQTRLNEVGVPARERGGFFDPITDTLTTCLTEDEIKAVEERQPGLILSLYVNDVPGNGDGQPDPEDIPTAVLSDGRTWYVGGQTESGELLLYVELKAANLPESDEKQAMLTAWLENEFGYNAEAYADGDAYNRMYRSEMEAIAEKNAAAADSGKKSIPYEEMNYISWRDNLPDSADEAVRADVEESRRLRLYVLRELCTEKLNAFIETWLPGQSDVKTDTYTATLWLHADRETVEKLATIEDVTAIYGWNGSEEPECGDNSTDNGSSSGDYWQQLSQIGADPLTGTQSAQYNQGSGLTGNGVTVGIIEAVTGGQGRFDASSPQLNNTSRFTYLVNSYDGVDVTATVGEHATAVTALLAGASVTPLGMSCYSGVLPNASVVQTACNSADTFRSGVELLAENGATVINASLCFTSGNDSYTAMDVWTDAFIRQTMIPIVVCAGNTSNQLSNKVTTPGRAFNTITVGNAVGYANGLLLSAPLSVSADSNYVDCALMDEKPDIVAPGTSLGYVKSDYTVYTGSGTSYASPLVAGIIGQMQEANSLLTLRPAAVTKAMLCLGADSEGVSATDNPTVAGCSLVHEKSGAGLLNAPGAIDAVSHSSQYAILQYNLYTISSDYERNLYINLSAGDTLRIVFNTEANLSAVNQTSKLCNFDYTLLDTDGNEVTSSSSTGCIDIMEYTVSESGRYTVRISLTAVGSFPTSSTPFYLAYAFSIE